MRSSRMRGYGSWCIGWNEAERNPPPPNNNNGCGILFYGFFILVALCFFKTALETGTPLGFLFGIAVIAGLIKGIKD